MRWLQGAAASVSPASTPLLASCSPAIIKKYLYICKNICILHLLAIALSLCEKVPNDALGEEGPHVRGPRLPHHLKVDLQVPLEGDLVHWEEQSVISVDKDVVRDICPPFHADDEHKQVPLIQIEHQDALDAKYFTLNILHFYCNQNLNKSSTQSGLYPIKLMFACAELEA